MRARTVNESFSKSRGHKFLIPDEAKGKHRNTEELSTGDIVFISDFNLDLKGFGHMIAIYRDLGGNEFELRPVYTEREGIEADPYDSLIFNFEEAEDGFHLINPSSELYKFIKSKKLNESMHTEQSYPIATVTWEDVKPEDGKSIQLPVDAGSSEVIRHENQFNYWLEEFIRKYGEEGELVNYYDDFLRDRRWKVVGNPKFAGFTKASGKGYSDYYSSPGRYKGD